LITARRTLKASPEEPAHPKPARTRCTAGEPHLGHQGLTPAASLSRAVDGVVTRLLGAIQCVLIPAEGRLGRYSAMQLQCATNHRCATSYRFLRADSLWNMAAQFGVVAVGTFALLLVALWTITSHHVGWRRLGLALAPVSGLSAYILSHNPLVAALAAICTAPLILGAREVTAWVRDGFR
jgi:hypothetical protein